MVCLDGQADTKRYRNCWLVDMKDIRRMKNLASPVTEGYLSETCAALPYTTVVMEISWPIWDWMVALIAVLLLLLEHANTGPPENGR